MRRVNEPPADPQRMERSLVRSIGVLLAIAILVPLGLYALFERQARRLEALGDHGEPVVATVTGISGDGSVHYAYAVDGTPYTWSVAPEDAPYDVGHVFTAHYLPEDPAFSRPGPDRSVATREAADNRAGTWPGLLAFFWFFAAFAISSAIELRALRQLGAEAYASPEALPARMRRRLATLALVVGPLLVAIFAWHARDAEARGESMVGVVLGVVVALGVLGGTLYYALREGPAQASARAARLARWAAPLAAAIAVLRLIALALGH